MALLLTGKQSRHSQFPASAGNWQQSGHLPGSVDSNSTWPCIWTLEPDPSLQPQTDKEQCLSKKCSITGWPILKMKRKEPSTCCVADVQVHHILLVKEKGAEIGAAGSQHSFVCLEVNPIYDKGAVTQQALLALAVELLQNFPAVPRELHRTS